MLWLNSLFPGAWGCCGNTSTTDFQEAKIQVQSRRSASLSSGPSMCTPRQVADQETTLNELRIKKEPKISTEPNFAAPSTPVRTNFERPGAQTPRTPRGTKIKEEKAGVGIVFAIREDTFELEVDSFAQNGSAQEHSSTIMPGDVLIEVDGIPTKNLEHAEIGKLIIGSPGSTARIIFKREFIDVKTGQIRQNIYATDIMRKLSNDRAKRPNHQGARATYA